MSDFKVAHAFTAKWEGGLSDHPSDPGGITKYGVSLRWLKDEGVDIDHDGDVDADDVRSLTRDEASKLFKERFWDLYNCGLLGQSLATVYYDTLVNTGPRQTNLILQRAVNALSPDSLVVDGKLGPKTLAAIVAASPLPLARSVINYRDQFYCSLAMSKPSMEVFLAGWLNRTRDLSRYISEV